MRKKPANTQDGYEQIRDWLARPGATKCMDETNLFCVYDNRRGNHCAIGGPMRVIMDEEIAGFEEGIQSLIHHNEKVNEFWENVDLDFLEGAQAAHDGAEMGPNFQMQALSKLDKVAIESGLELAK